MTLPTLATAALLLSAASAAHIATNTPPNTNAKRLSCDEPCVLLEFAFNEYIPAPWSVPLNSVPQTFNIGNATDVSKIIVKFAQGALTRDVVCTGTWSTAFGGLSTVSFDSKDSAITPSDGVSLNTVACGTSTTKRAPQSNLTAGIWVDIDDENEPTIYANVTVNGEAYLLPEPPSNVKAIHFQQVVGGPGLDVLCHTKWSIGQGGESIAPLSMMYIGLPPEREATLIEIECGSDHHASLT